jgi:hypothetical protein
VFRYMVENPTSPPNINRVLPQRSALATRTSFSLSTSARRVITGRFKAARKLAHVRATLPRDIPMTVERVTRYPSRVRSISTVELPITPYHTN